MWLSSRAYTDLSVARRDEALQLQAAEYARRLAELNHAHERQVEVQRTYVSMERHEALMSKVAELENFKSKMIGAAIILPMVTAVVGAMIARTFA